MKRKLIIGTLFSAVFLYLALKGIQWTALVEALKHARYIYLLPSVGFTLLNLWLRAYRWRFLLQPVKSVSTNSLLSATAIGYMANNLLPARLGELVRAYVLGKQEQISKTASFATIVYERIVDVFSLLVLLWLVFLDVPGPEWLNASAISLLVLNIAAFVIVLFVERHRERTAAFVERATSRLPDRLRAKINEGTAAFITGLGAVRDARALIPISVMTFLIWLSAALAAYYCFGALDLDVPLVASVTVIVLISFGSMIPSAPGYVGTTQYASIVALALYGVGNNEALAYSILYHASIFIPVTLAGLIYLWKTHIRFDELSRRGYG